MDAKFYWEVFLDTGAPEMFLLYRSLNQNENDTRKESVSNAETHFYES